VFFDRPVEFPAGNSSHEKANEVVTVTVGLLLLQFPVYASISLAYDLSAEFES